MASALAAVATARWVAVAPGLLVAVALALTVFRMPAVLVVTAAAHGVVFGVMRIAWIVEIGRAHV